jgi:hypothetical protein
MEDMAVVYRFVLNPDDEGRASILVTNQRDVAHHKSYLPARQNLWGCRPVQVVLVSKVNCDIIIV